jgi:hypothetical protein
LIEESLEVSILLSDCSFVHRTEPTASLLLFADAVPAGIFHINAFDVLPAAAMTRCLTIALDFAALALITVE